MRSITVIALILLLFARPAFSQDDNYKNTDRLFDLLPGNGAA